MTLWIRGEDRYWYRAVDKQGNTVDFLLTAKRDRRAAQRFFTRAVKNNRLPKIVNIDKSPRSTASVWIAPKQGSVPRSGPALSRRNGASLSRCAIAQRRNSILLEPPIGF